MAFSILSRKQDIERLKNEKLDLLTIGGGITGAGVAIQASSMGMNNALIEMQDFAEGTSSRSTKLVHGGIRYLKNFDVEVVSDTVKERAVVQGVAPHIPRPDPMLLPIYDEPGATFDMFSVKVAMNLYDQLAGVTDPKFTNYTISKEEVLQREPQLKPEGLLGGGVYLDFRNNDARLVIENIKKAHENGGLMVSHIQALHILHDENGRVNGVHVKDLLNDEEFDIHANLVINTTGPWSDFIREMDDKQKVVPQMRPTKGVHLVVDSKRLSVPQPTYFDSGKQDGRMIFVIPREDKTYFGTTDTDYKGDFKHPRVEQEDIDYLFDIINTRYPEAHITVDDIEASWAGLRPLISSNGSSDYNGGNSGKITSKSFDEVIDIVDKFEKKEASHEDVEDVLNNLESTLSEGKLNPSAVSRGSSLEVSDDGLITLAGGKITDYRKMAAGAIALIAQLLKKDFGENFNEIDSKHLEVSGGDIDPNNVDATISFFAKQGIESGLSKEEAERIANLFGSNASRVFSQIGKIDAAPGLSLAETISLHYSLDEEMTLTPVDYLLRRTNHLLFQHDTINDIKDGVVNEMARYFNWSDAEKDAQMKKLNDTIDEASLKYLK
ncbi:type 1 glycerol-3-phosphate oxidase [Pediococcus argentinicus]|uniref:Alpha-glycerophosphate oxidase n=1 Tax=Pediococcus argentinicus TaxID=480391 RepID=A0A0R2NNR5_9LACO|nr:type 1 glycerol-3-phosphate oxidase [Pediococcus argentinicus]KRO25645.1 glycerol-3-phosphate dehydrogenase [Pediococcus argentinicus]NKZ22017.1 type 1 glycerol-3-phosphate oxidase [Pediococcus argentinicus]GEP19188.1 alpha-glycerophosphate oxidase [Pediococcus argentinicus]